MLMCRSPFQGLLFIYTSQSQPPRCQPRTLAWHAHLEGGEGAGEGTLANRTGRRDGGVFLLVKEGHEVRLCCDGKYLRALVECQPQINMQNIPGVGVLSFFFFILLHPSEDS